MPLRLRRGTDTERQTITPQEGELIYVTDTKELWAGDGTTQGGIKVTGIIPERLNDLGDVNLSIAPQIGQVLKWNGLAFVAADDIDTNISTAGIIEGSNYRINIVGDDSTLMVDTFTKVFTGDASGLTNFPADVGIVPGGNYNINIVGDDSTIIVDTLTGIISGVLVSDTLYSDTSTLTFGNDLTDTTNEFKISSNNSISVLKMTRTSDVDISAVTQAYGAIYFEGSDANGSLTTALILGRPTSIILSASSDGSFPVESFIAIADGGLLGVGTPNPTEKLDVRGNGVFTGFVQFGSVTTSERSALSPVNGMVVYNTTDNKFQGYQNDVWINLDTGSAA